MIFTGVWRVFPEKGIAFNSHNGNAAYIQATPDGFVIWGINIPATWMLKELADWVAKNMTPNDLGNRRDAGPIGGVSELTDEFDHTTNGDG